MNDESNEMRIYGPPGCGKTTFLCRQITRAADKYGADNVLVTSFTKAAATELAGRALPLSKGLVGTLHSHCYRALGHPVIAEKHIGEWNKEFGKCRLSPSGHDVDEFEPDLTIKTFGDELFAKQQVLRAKMIPREQWPTAVRKFGQAWDTWKSNNGLLDFTDLIETGVRDLRTAPSNPNVIIVDESQDLTLLQLTLVRQWGRYADYLMLAADDDQTIFTFAGAAPEVLLQGTDNICHRQVLSQSYRVPRAVHALSERWIRQVKMREEKEYRPRDADGRVRLFHKGNYKAVKAVVDHAETQIAAGRSVMFLASCSYMLEPLKRALRNGRLPMARAVGS